MKTWLNYIIDTSRIKIGLQYIRYIDEYIPKLQIHQQDILFCIIIIITPSKDVVPPIRDVIDVFGHVKTWGKTSIVSWVISTHKSIIKMYFESCKASRSWKQGEVGPFELLGLLANKYKWVRNFPHLDKQNTQAVALEREREVHMGERKQSNISLGVLYVLFFRP